MFSLDALAEVGQGIGLTAVALSPLILWRSNRLPVVRRQQSFIHAVANNPDTGA